MNQTDIDRIFDAHTSTPEQLDDHRRITEAFKRCAITVSNLPNGRERAIVLTKLEEASFFAHAAIAREGL